MSIIGNLRNHLIKHKIEKIEVKNNALHFYFKSLSTIGKKYLVLKDRSSGRRIQSLIKHNEVKIPLVELSELNRDGIYDASLKNVFFHKVLTKRLKFDADLAMDIFIDKENKNEIKIHKTVNRNLTLISKAIVFDMKVTQIAQLEYGFLIQGNLIDIEKQKPISGEIVLGRRDVVSYYFFPINIEEGQNDIYKFTGELDLKQMKDLLVLNSRWDVSLRLKDQTNKVIYSDLIYLQTYRDFSKEEDRYIIEFQQDDILTSLYATMGRNSMALWHTDMNQFQTTYNIAKGKSVFKEVSNTEELDENMIFFESFLGKNYSGNPKYLYEEMLESPFFKEFTFVWSYTGENQELIKGNPIIVQRESEEYYRYLAKSKYWINNILFPVHYKREGNVYIQTWHGTPLKRLGFDIEIEGPETLARENLYLESRNWDYLVSANNYSSNHFRSAFKYNKEMLEVGYPANDILHQNDVESKIGKLKKELNIPADKKVILYAPTWRDTEAVGSWKHAFHLKFNLRKFYELFNDEYVLILRMHHLISENIVIDEEYQHFVYDFSHFDDIQELYLLSDILITDYSSVFFDFANTKRPILFYAYDYEEYKDNIRGFYLDMEKELPGPIIKTENELFDAVKHIDSVSEEYKEKYEEFYQRFCSLEDGKAAQRIIKRVFLEND